ncbi:MAG: DUF3025 domain-containing protein [Variovorax sp.]
MWGAHWRSRVPTNSRCCWIRRRRRRRRWRHPRPAARRGALTLFNENGAVLDAPPAPWDALTARDWQRLFVSARALWCEARLLVSGHALLEKNCRRRVKTSLRTRSGRPVCAARLP